MSSHSISLFKHIKLSTMGLFFTCGFALSALVFIASSIIINSNVSLASSVWTEYKANKSEKIRIDSALRSSLGYGGAIHEFKNYLLRPEPWRIERVQAKLGAVNAAISQFNTLGPSNAQAIALNDIKNMVDAYSAALIQAELLFSQGLQPLDVDKQVIIDDSLAMRGLQILNQELQRELHINNPSDDSPNITKADLAVKLRSALGYGGFIHNFKNAVLRGDEAYLSEAAGCLVKAEELIALYRNQGLTSAEHISLEDITRTLNNYKQEIDTIRQLISQNASPQYIDQQVKINDTSALRGLAVLDREIVVQIEQSADNVSATLDFVTQLISWLSWFTVIFTTVFIIAAILLMRNRLMNPIKELIKAMKTLAEGNFNIKIFATDRDNEIGEMARALEIFSANALKHRDSEAQVQAVINTAVHAIVTTNDRGVIVALNPAALAIFDYELDDILGRNIKLLMPQANKSFTDSVQGKVYEEDALRANGVHFPIELSVNEMTVGDKLMYTTVIHDITARRAAEAEIRKLAMTDPLTGVANRNQFELCIEEAIQVAEQNNKSVGLLLLDLNKFKPVNDTYGHHVGDQLLKDVSARMVEASRQTDTVARLGGDEFAIIFNHLDTPECIKVPFDRLVSELSRPYVVNDMVLNVTASIGVSMYPQDDTNIDELLRKADLAMYKNKNIDLVS
ncbi:sensor domain-containing diguanylate cyclase [Moritella sp. Urea-trap-13]|uniref:sensor domain-containing diguanylate cyclase n=1 Tax=Moritella sp. Urea-trap-13 TaxID=2058327 RepID=UPI000C329E61|nr:sensor domain-containing diguanylate cyclase [Moritella sp. Urea-trap-13]PKH05634.1 PAS domain S-box protein [Moritella sp. Urea-trap-13]